MMWSYVLTVDFDEYVVRIVLGQQRCAKRALGFANKHGYKVTMAGPQASPYRDFEEAHLAQKILGEWVDKGLPLG